MSAPVSRLALAREAGLFGWPAGPVAVFGPVPETALAELPRAECRIVSHDARATAALRARGFAVDRAPPERAAAAVVFVPRGKAEARALLAEATRVAEGPVVIDGQKTDGVESLIAALKGRAATSEVMAKAHGKLAVLPHGQERAARLADWRDPGPRPVAGGFVTRLGVFSADGPDRGSALLAEALPPRLGPRVAELGAGWGYLARAILAREGVVALDLVEADARALDCARLNVTDPRARFLWADATAHRPEAPYDTVVTNPPFHAGRAGDPGLGQAFIAAAAGMLAPAGTLWLVANRHLPYERSLAAAFGEVAEAGGDAGYKILRAARPRRARREERR